MSTNLLKRTMGSGAAFAVLWGVFSSGGPVAKTAQDAISAILMVDYQREEVLGTLASVTGAVREAWFGAPRIRIPDETPAAPALATSPPTSPPWTGQGDELPMDDAPRVPVLLPPLHGVVANGFGRRIHPISGDPDIHNGVDIAADLGTKVVASLDGMVEYSGPAGTLGNAVYISHAGLRRTRYGHLSELMVKTGDRVTAGQVIGSVGSTGAATGPHLHFEFWEQGKPVDPAGRFSWSQGRV